MNSIRIALLKSVVIPFYRVHAGLLLFVFLVMFGTVESNQLVNYHRTLIEGILQTPAFAIMTCVVWALYAAKIVLYILSLLKKPDYTFMTGLMLLSRRNSFIQILLTIVACFAPVLAYSFFIYLIGFSKGYYTLITIIIAFQCMLCFLSTLTLEAFLRTQHRFRWATPNLRIPHVSGRIGFYMSYFLTEEKLSLLISKAFSICLLYIVREATETVGDFRIVGLAWIFVLLSHTFLIRKLQMFEDRYLRWTKNLPFSAINNCLLYCTFFVTLLLPELLFTLSISSNLLYWGMLILLSSGMQTYVYAYLLKPDRDPEKFSGFLFWLFLGSFFAVLSKMAVPLSLALIAVACVRIIQRYYRYEPAVE